MDAKLMSDSPSSGLGPPRGCHGWGAEGRPSMDREPRIRLLGGVPCRFLGDPAAENILTRILDPGRIPSRILKTTIQRGEGR